MLDSALDAAPASNQSTEGKVDDPTGACEDARMLKLLRRLLFLGVLTAAAYALWKRFAGVAGDEPTRLTWQAQPSPFPPAPVFQPAGAAQRPVVVPEVPPSAVAAPLPSASTAPASSGAWVEPDDGACPVSHPVKAKLASGIFHLPGGQNYERTRADRCYADASSAEADGLRAAKR